MAPANTQGKQQLPAAHPNLRAYVDTANACLKAWARANRQDWEGLTNRHALLLQALLEKSKPEGKRGAVQIIPLQELKNLFADELTGRKWEEFLGWYEREIEYSLKKTCAERKEEVLYPGRSSSGNGGRGEKGKAIYFLSFDRPVRAAKPRRKRDTAVTGTAAQGDGQPIADIPPTDSNASASSRVSKEHTNSCWARLRRLARTASSERRATSSG
jgi:hypothetical protein